MFYTVEKKQNYRPKSSIIQRKGTNTLTREEGSPKGDFKKMIWMKH